MNKNNVIAGLLGLALSITVPATAMQQQGWDFNSEHTHFAFAGGMLALFGGTKATPRAYGKFAPLVLLCAAGAGLGAKLFGKQIVEMTKKSLGYGDDTATPRSPVLSERRDSVASVSSLDGSELFESERAGSPDPDTDVPSSPTSPVYARKLVLPSPAAPVGRPAAGSVSSLSVPEGSRPVASSGLSGNVHGPVLQMNRDKVAHGGASHRYDASGRRIEYDK